MLYVTGLGSGQDTSTAEVSWVKQNAGSQWEVGAIMISVIKVIGLDYDCTTLSFPVSLLLSSQYYYVVLILYDHSLY
jgi:hypothetical protein